MSDLTDRKWPTHLPMLPDDEIFALGVISLEYGFLESTFQWIFVVVTGMPEQDAFVKFQKIKNDKRKKIVSEMLCPAALPSELKELVRHFIEGFAICADNRNYLLHSQFGGMDTAPGEKSELLLMKFNKSGGQEYCRASLPVLQAVADSMHVFAEFGLNVYTLIDQRLRARARKREHLCQPLSLGKPALPAELNWGAQP